MSVDMGTFGQIDNEYARHAAWQEAKKVGILRFFETDNCSNFLVEIKRKDGSNDDPSFWGIMIPHSDLNTGIIAIPTEFGSDNVFCDKTKVITISEIVKHNLLLMGSINFHYERGESESNIESLTARSWYFLKFKGENGSHAQGTEYLAETLAEGMSIEFGESFPRLELNPLKLPKSVYDTLNALYPLD